MPGRRFSVSTVFRAVDRFSLPIKKMEKGVRRFARKTERALNRAARKAGKFFRAFRKGGRVLAVVGLAFGVAARQVIKAGADFEQAITNVGAVGLRTRGQIRALEEQAKRLGATTKFTATESANAMEILAKAGFKNQEILAAVPGVLDAAAASGLEMAEVANVVSNALKGMGLQASEASRVSDVLALASARTNSTIGSLGDSLANVSSTARQLSVPLEDVVASVALLQDVGLPATVAGSAMNTMLTKLATPTAALEKKMRKFGVKLKDVHGDMLPLPEVLENFGKAAKKSGGNLEVVAFFAELVGLRGQKAATNLKDLFASGRFSKLAEELRDAEGAAKKMAELRMDTLLGDITILKSTWEGIKIDIFDSSASDLRDMVQSMTTFLRQNKLLITALAGDPFGAFREMARNVEDISDVLNATPPMEREKRNVKRRIDDMRRLNRVTFGRDIHQRTLTDEQLDLARTRSPLLRPSQQPSRFDEPQVLRAPEVQSRTTDSTSTERIQLNINDPENRTTVERGRPKRNTGLEIPASGVPE